jgi:tungstate transport system substrate-binding protein
MLKHKQSLLAILALVALSLSALLFADGQKTSATQSLRLLSTTSTDNSGLLAYLIPRFKAAHGIDIQALVMGTGQAIRAAQNGDGDLLLVHDKPSEQVFMDAGYGHLRREIMYNDFILVGPREDPAGLRKINTAHTAFTQLAHSQAPFVSRGDSSGTHRAEQRLWRLAGIQPDKLSPPHYREVGAGMGRTLNIAASLNAYTLVDRGTWLSFKNKQNLAVLFEGDKQLFNQYSIISLKPERFPHLQHDAAQTLVDWLSSEEGQGAIAEFKIGGEALFFPNYTP